MVNDKVAGKTKYLALIVVNPFFSKSCKVCSKKIVADSRNSSDENQDNC
jgi:predicted nucleic acid-binding Zn ribbon protein